MPFGELMTPDNMAVYNFKAKIHSDLIRKLTKSDKSKLEAESAMFMFIESITTDTIHQIMNNLQFGKRWTSLLGSLIS